MKKMTTFDSFTLVPAYSEISSRDIIDVSTTICGTKSNLPIINANMLSICTQDMINILTNKYNNVSSYHRFFESENTKKNVITSLLEQNKNPDFTKLFWMSLGVKVEEYDFVYWLYERNIKNVIVDVNHGHSKMVAEICNFIKKNFKDVNIMAGNVSSTDGIKFLVDNGADIVKCGNSFGFSCTTIKATSCGVHPLHVVKAFREETDNYDVKLCLDGGIRDISDIVKSLIWGDMVMLGKLFAGCDESYGTKIRDFSTNAVYKEYFGNASIKTKQVANEENHVKHIEGTTKLVPCVGPIDGIMKDIKEGLQSAFSFMNAKNIDEFQRNVQKQILYV